MNEKPDVNVESTKLSKSGNSVLIKDFPHGSSENKVKSPSKT